MASTAKKRREQKPVDPANPVVRAITFILQKKGWSQTELSEKSGLAKSHINQIMAGWQTPVISLDTARKIAQAGGVSIRMFGFEDEVGTGADRMPDADVNRDAVADMMERKGRDASAIFALRKHPPDPTKTVDDWMRRFLELEAASAQVSAVDREPPPVSERDRSGERVRQVK